MNPDLFQAHGAYFYAQDDMIVRHIRSGKGAFEPYTAQWIFEKISADGLFVDVGASTGWYTVPVAMRGKQVVAFEPLPNSRRRLVENIALNNVTDMVAVIAAAVSDVSGTSEFGFNPRLPLTSGASLIKDVGGNTASMVVNTITVDEVIDASVSVLKVDVEGAECLVLDGAQNTIMSSRPFMVLEANTREHAEALAPKLQALGYEWKFADKRNMLCTPL